MKKYGLLGLTPRNLIIEQEKLTASPGPYFLI